MMIATLAIAGIPPFSGFFSKDEILAVAFGRGEHEPLFRVYWAMGATAALLTAFYMARLIAMTFFGENRTGAREAEHLHEAPWIMTAPLLVLGVLSIGGGAINSPEWLQDWLTPNRLERWLHPLTSAGARIAVGLGTSAAAPEGSAEQALIALAVVIAVAGLVLGGMVTRRAKTVPAHDASPERGFWKVLYNKYYVDELYDRIIVKPLIGFSGRVLWNTVDQGVIDGAAVNGSAGVSRALGWIGSRLQSGQVGVYVVFFLVGALYVLGMVAWR
jgi:NADH-quinone oxidoreductase subunit L